MNLRYHIFIFITVLGLLPLAILLATSLPQGLQQLDQATQQETVARSRIRYAKLSARISCLKKSITRLAAVPAARDLLLSATPENSKRISTLTHDWFRDDEQIQSIQMVDVIGNELLRMTREDGHLQEPDSNELSTIEESPPFLHGIQLFNRAVMVGVSRLQTEQNSTPTLFMVTPVMDNDANLLGMAILTVKLDSFLHDFSDSLWLMPDLSQLNDIPALPDFTIPAPLYDRSLINTDIITSSFDTGDNKIGWLPLSFNPDHRPILWIASPIDMSELTRWKQAIIRNILIIVGLTGIVVFGLAHFIASHALTIKTEIIKGLQQLLHQNKPFTFSWRGPPELHHLAYDLTCVGENYVKAQGAKNHAETALRASEENFRSLTSAALDGIIMMNKQGDITFWNKAAETFFGYDADEAVGKPIHALIAPKRQETGEDLFAQDSKTDVSDIIPLIATRKDGSKIQVELSLSSASLSEQWHAIWIIRDISERIKNEKKARKQQQQLIQADKMISLGLLVAGVAHEINNPNSIILLNTPHLRRSWESTLPILDEFHEDHGDFRMGGLHYSEMKDLIPKLINNIEEGGQRIKQIVSDLKDYARQDSDYQFKPLMLNDVVQAALRLTKNKTKNATQNLQVSLQPDLPLIQGNSRRLEQVIINLINNSCEALADKEKSISIITSYDSNVNLVKLRIGDEGCGIDPQALTKITDPFYTSKRHQGGTGLGLSVSAGIIKEHRGHLHFTSKTGQGTTATITFTNHEPDTIPSHTAD